MDRVKHCARCILPESFPGISLGEDGVCSVCRTWEQGEDKRREGQDHHLELFRRLVDKTRESRAHAGGSYDLLMAYSGGKDSTFTLGVLCRRFGLKVLALTFDNGFMAPGARENIRKVTTALGVDHLMVTPAFDTLRKAFAASVSGHRYPPGQAEQAPHQGGALRLR